MIMMVAGLDMMALDQRGASGRWRLVAFGVDYGIIAAYLGALVLVGVLGRAIDLLPTTVTTPGRGSSASPPGSPR
jgi:hypothetical protein